LESRARSPKDHFYTAKTHSGREYFNSQLGTRSDRRHYHLAHLQISLLSDHRSKLECPSAPARATRRGVIRISSQFAWKRRKVGNHQPRLVLTGVGG
jgi:hypothetical protein